MSLLSFAFTNFAPLLLSATLLNSIIMIIMVLILGGLTAGLILFMLKKMRK